MIKLYPGFISLGLNFSHWWTLTLRVLELNFAHSFKVIRISLQFYFPLWRCDLGVILTLIDLSSSASESLAQMWSVWQLPCFYSSGYQKKHSWNHSDSSDITRETSKVYIYNSSLLWLHATNSFLRGYQRYNSSHNSQATLLIFTVRLLEIQ